MRGFTLIETIISIVVIGIAFLGLAAVFTGVFTNATRDEVMTVATMLAKGEMEKVTGVSFADIDDENMSDFVSFSEENFTDYSKKIIVSNSAYGSEYREVEVLIRNAMIGDVNLKTIVTNN